MSANKSIPFPNFFKKKDSQYTTRQGIDLAAMVICGEIIINTYDMKGTAWRIFITD
jgi:hypothetical protein